MINLLKEFTRGDHQLNLKTADGTGAGTGDTVNKAVDVKFSLMRNMINKDGGVSGSDINNYLEKAHDLNDEIDTVGFAIETDDGEIIKIYVNAEQADQFEEEMSNFLGLDDDTEVAINALAQKFDIIDVIWPEDPQTDEDPYADLTIDNAIDADFDDEESDVDAEIDAEIDADKDTKSLMKDVTSDDDLSDAPKSDDDTDTEDDEESTEEDELELDSNGEPIPMMDDDGNPVLDANGNPVMKKKKKSKKKDDAEESGPEEIKTEEGFKLMGSVTEGIRDEIESHVHTVKAAGNKGKWYLEGLVTGGTRGRVQYQYKRAGKVQYFEDEAQAIHEAEKLNKQKNVAGAKAAYKFTPKLVEDMNEMIKDRSDMTDEEFSLDDIRKAVKPIFDKLEKIDDDAAYAKFLETFRSHKDVVDQYVGAGNNIDSIANKIHYQQQLDKQLHLFLKDIMPMKTESTIGSSFLSRITEATDGPKMDTAWKGLYARMKRPYEKKIIQFFAAVGIPGRYAVNEDGIVEAIQEAGDMLRRAGRKQTLFNKLYDMIAPSQTSVSESTSDAASIVNGLVQMAAARDKPHTVDADDIRMLKADAEDKLKAGWSVADVRSYIRNNEAVDPDLDEDTALRRMKAISDKYKKVNEAKKRGGRVQKILEAVLIRLGLPAVLTTTEGAGVLGTVFARMANKIDADAQMQGALINLAKAMGITSSELNEEHEELDEDVNVGNDEFFKSVIELCVSLGIPEANLNYQRAAVLQSLRKKKLMLQNRGMLQGRIDALNGMVAKATRKTPGTPDQVEESLTEAFAPLEAMTKKDLQGISMEEPAAGPGMTATYEGGGKHEETLITLAVDPDADDENKSLRVGIDGPWDGDMHSKFFPDTKVGYKEAVEYANMLRTANLKSGGRPKGWKDAPAKVSESTYFRDRLSESSNVLDLKMVANELQKSVLLDEVDLLKNGLEIATRKNDLVQIDVRGGKFYAEVQGKNKKIDAGHIGNSVKDILTFIKGLNKTWYEKHDSQ